MKKIENYKILKYLEDLPGDELNSFLIDFCRSIEKRKKQIIDINGFDPFPKGNIQDSSNQGSRYNISKQVIRVLMNENLDELVTSNKALNQPRYNKYGLIMDELEQQLDDIKLRFKTIEKYVPEKHPNAVQFFWDIYKIYIDARVIYQRDLLVIDPQLLTNIKNCFRKGKAPKIQYLDEFGVKIVKSFDDINKLLPSREHIVNDLKNKIADDEKVVTQFTHQALSLLRHNS